MIMGIKKPSNVFLCFLPFFPAIRHASWYGGSSQYCPCVCMPSQQWFVYLFFVFCFFLSLFLLMTSVVILIVLHCLYYYVQFPAFLRSAFQTKTDSRLLLLCLARRSYSHLALAALQSLLGWESAVLESERERLYVGSGCSISHLKALFNRFAYILFLCLRTRFLKWVTVSAGVMHKHRRSHQESYQL